MSGDPEMRHGQMYPLTAGTVLFGLAVGLIGVAVALGVVVLLKTLLGEGLMQVHSGAAAAMGAIVICTQTMKDFRQPARGGSNGLSPWFPYRRLPQLARQWPGWS